MKSNCEMLRGRSAFVAVAVPSSRRLIRRAAHALIALGWSFAAAGPLGAQVDSGSHRSLFTWDDAVLAGVFVVGTVAIRPFDKSTATELQTPSIQSRRMFRRTAEFVRWIAQPGSTIIGLSMYATGRLSGSERLAAVGLHGTEALAIGAITGDVMKDFFGRARPYVDTTGPNPNDWQLGRGLRRGGNYQSFPSGHTTAAFAAAAAVTAETSVWWPELSYFLIGPVMYGGAASVGLSRMYNNRHWASDVIMGAAIGTFAGNKVVRYHRTHPGNRVDRLLLNANWNPADGHLSFSLIPGIGLKALAR